MPFRAHLFLYTQPLKILSPSFSLSPHPSSPLAGPRGTAASLIKWNNVKWVDGDACDCNLNPNDSTAVIKVGMDMKREVTSAMWNVPLHDLASSFKSPLEGYQTEAHPSLSILHASYIPPIQFTPIKLRQHTTTSTTSLASFPFALDFPFFPLLPRPSSPASST